MNIVIAGAGKVGYRLAKTLLERHSVTVVDENAEALERLQESLDILPVHGNIENPDTYRKIIDKNVDLYIAVTNSDEANLLSILVAEDALDIERKFIRLRNVSYSSTYIQQRLGIDEIFYPLNLTASSIISLLKYPYANNVKGFQYTDMKLISVRVVGGLDSYEGNRRKVAIVGIERDGNFFVPDYEEIPMEGDLLYLFGNGVDIGLYCMDIGCDVSTRIERCAIFGAGDLGINIASSLLEHGVDVKIVEKSPELCNRADEILAGGAMTLSCKYGMEDIYDEELYGADMIISATGNDEYNIVKCLEAREHGIGKLLAINNDLEHYKVMHSLGIIAVRGPKVNAYNTIIESIESNGIVMERRFCGGDARVFMRKIFEGSELDGKKRALPSRLKKCRAIVVRGEEMIPLSNDTILEYDDVITLFCEEGEANRAREWIDGL